MARKALLPGYERLPGKSERVLNKVTGEVISDRQYKKLAREFSPTSPITSTGKKITSNEALAKFNREAAPEVAAARPARGRTSLRKAPVQLQQERARALRELARQAEERKRVDKERREVERKVERAKKKKVRQRNVSPAGFKKDKRTGERRRAAQYDFTSYDEMVELHEQAQEIRSIRFWGVGIRGVDERTGNHLDAWLWGLSDIRLELDEDELDELTEDFLEAKPYFVFTSWYAHFKKGRDL